MSSDLQEAFAPPTLVSDERNITSIDASISRLPASRGGALESREPHDGKVRVLPEHEVRLPRTFSPGNISARNAHSHLLHSSYHTSGHGSSSAPAMAQANAIQLRGRSNVTIDRPTTGALRPFAVIERVRWDANRATPATPPATAAARAAQYASARTDSSAMLPGGVHIQPLQLHPGIHYDASHANVGGALSSMHRAASPKRARAPRTPARSPARSSHLQAVGFFGAPRVLSDRQRAMADIDLRPQASFVSVDVACLEKSLVHMCPCHLVRRRAGASFDFNSLQPLHLSSSVPQHDSVPIRAVDGRGRRHPRHRPSSMKQLLTVAGE